MPELPLQSNTLVDLTQKCRTFWGRDTGSHQIDYLYGRHKKKSRKCKKISDIGLPAAGPKGEMTIMRCVALYKG